MTLFHGVSLWLPAESVGEVVCSLANDFYVFHDAIKHQHVAAEIIQGHGLDVVLNTLDGILDVLKSLSVSNGLSHISVFCRDWHFQRRRGAILLPPPSPPCGQAVLPSRSLSHNVSVG